MPALVAGIHAAAAARISQHLRIFLAWMAGTSPAMTAGCLSNAKPSPFPPVRGGWVYIMTNRPNGTLYLGVTNDLARRAFEHREGRSRGFTQFYGLKRLVWYDRTTTSARRSSARKR